MPDIDRESIQKWDKKEVHPIFDESVIDFLDDLSKGLRKVGKDYPDIMTFAFWCRRASLENYKKMYGKSLDHRLGRGTVFHIAPSNVAMNFAYSLSAGLLAGNANIVRLPSVAFEQVNIFCEIIENVFQSHPSMRDWIHLVNYGHEKELTDVYSSIADVRIIWGGDRTIQTIRLSPLSPRGVEIALADRYSIFLIDASHFLSLSKKNKEEVVYGFYNDTYLSDQNACTSPRLVVWLGKEIRRAQDVFWNLLYRLVKETYPFQVIQGIDKYMQLCRCRLNYKDPFEVNIHDNFIYRIEVAYIEAFLEKMFYHSGFFIEYKAEDIEEILPILGRKCQTIIYQGIHPNRIKEFLMRTCPKGVDRIKPVGHSMDFDLKWDGYDLIRMMSRCIQG